MTSLGSCTGHGYRTIRWSPSRQLSDDTIWPIAEHYAKTINHGQYEAQHSTRNRRRWCRWGGWMRMQINSVSLTLVAVSPYRDRMTCPQNHTWVKTRWKLTKCMIFNNSCPSEQLTAGKEHPWAEWYYFFIHTIFWRSSSQSSLTVSFTIPEVQFRIFKCQIT